MICCTQSLSNKFGSTVTSSQTGMYSKWGCSVGIKGIITSEYKVFFCAPHHGSRQGRAAFQSNLRGNLSSQGSLRGAFSVRRPRAILQLFLSKHPQTQHFRKNSTCRQPFSGVRLEYTTSPAFFTSLKENKLMMVSIVQKQTFCEFRFHRVARSMSSFHWAVAIYGRWLNQNA